MVTIATVVGVCGIEILAWYAFRLNMEVIAEVFCVDMWTGVVDAILAALEFVASVPVFADMLLDVVADSLIDALTGVIIG